MSEMIDRVARALYESHCFVKGWDHPDTREKWHHAMRAEARAALAAMRDAPAEVIEAGMLAAHAHATSPDRGFASFHGEWTDLSRQIYHSRLSVAVNAMIDEALKL